MSGHPVSGLGLTARQAELLAFITAEIEVGRSAPSYNEMAHRLGLTGKSGIHRLLTGLEERGHIVRMANRARSIALTGAASGAQPAMPLPAPVAARLRAYCARRRLAAREVIADALSDYMARNP